MNVKKKVLFINPPNDLTKNNNFSIGLYSLGTILKKQGYLVRIIDIDYITTKKLIDKYDVNNDDSYIQSVCNYIIDNNPDVVDFYTMSNSYYFTIKLSKAVKEKNNKIKVVFGGPQATLIAKETLISCPWIDAIGIGEGEASISNLINTLIEKKNFNNDAGVAYIDDNGVFISNKPHLVKNLDDLPLLDYSLFEGECDKTMNLDVGRGCPFGCKYCSTKTFWRRNFRLKSSERIIDEIIYLKDKYNPKRYNFEHDLFTANKKKVMEFCNMLLDKGIDIEWHCSSRADTLDEELISIMAKSGCRAIFLGIETGSPRIQKVINKNLNINKAIDTIKILRKYNIEITASLMYGFPEETENDLNSTLDLIFKLISLGVEWVQLHLFSLYPGTEYYDELKDKLYFSDNISDAAISKYLDERGVEFVTKHPNMFPQYLDFDLGVRKKFDFIDVYIYAYSRVFMRYMKKTYDLLVYIYGSHLNLFKNFRKVNEDKLIELKKVIYKLCLDPKICIRDIGNLIDNTEFKYKDVLKEVFRFECDIVNFIYYSDEEKGTYSYKYDVYAIKSNKLSIKDAEENENDIIFIRKNRNNDLTIKRLGKGRI